MKYPIEIEKEQKLIDLLGYSLIGPSYDYQWIVLDKEKQPVGHIRYQLLDDAISPDSSPDIFCYHTTIDSSEISWDFTRVANDQNGKAVSKNKFGFHHYSFVAKKYNLFYQVSIHLGDLPYLTIWSNDYGVISFDATNKLFISYRKKTDECNVEEVLLYKNKSNNTDDKEYSYLIKKWDKSYHLSDDIPEKCTSFSISGIKNSHKSNEILVSERTWVDGELKMNDDYLANGTIEGMAIRNQVGIDTFQYFRAFINDLLPFKEDIISTLVSDEIIEENNLYMFFPEYQKSCSDVRKSKSKRKK